MITGWWNPPGLVGLLAACLALQGAATEAGEPTRFQYTEVHMGLQTRVVLYASDERTARSAAAAAFRRISELDEVMSDYRASSELMRLCDRAGAGPVRVSADLMRVLSRAQQLAERSDGAFDVTCGPVVALWRRARREHRLPDAATLSSARALVGWRNLVLDRTRREVELKLPGMRLDLGGIAKGSACEAALAVLRRQGAARAMVEMGGDIALGDAPPGRSGWEIEIPVAGDSPARLRLRNCAVSTSGDTEQYVELGGLRYSHIVDPRTGLGLTSRIAVTVIAPSGDLSDGLSTAVSVLGEEAGRALASRYRGVRVFVRYAAGVR